MCLSQSALIPFATCLRSELYKVKNHTAGQNKKTTTAPIVDARKLGAAAEPVALERVATEVRQSIQKTRIEKKMSQAESAKQINERTQIVQKYEKTTERC
ncbi:hypothetical protein AG4045_025970 [Apium graveolens]|uniref:Multiprotein bridging factor 1 N-terminal domain-containing protein n=1 Tax=Apium graveolens TaxID=4045 RepID=A0A6L5BBI1_APIGR|nr:hypothetical protein AG4045_025970 [Apium graveolens]